MPYRPTGGQKTILRIRGDFLRESYIERGGEPISLEKFYQHMLKLNLKERIILNSQRFVFDKCSAATDKDSK